MVKRYVPDRGDLVWINLDPTLGREQKGRRPALVISPKSINSRSGLALMCPVTSQSKGYPFEVAIKNSSVQGVILTDHVRSIDWGQRKTSFYSKIDQSTLAVVQGHIVALVTGLT